MKPPPLHYFTFAQVFFCSSGDMQGKPTSVFQLFLFSRFSQTVPMVRMPFVTPAVACWSAGYV
ncbi:hypothetical protein T4D_1171 [Trichinella pseudospiralis]|uniref:Uncharacterized protein n=1 Tax=Trichinella pseudospiralis TaxID=6337 RepID=A0A0V1FH96_TRIPS|nr:hypothetical protein T4D_1171 [Trichinella pseudospiralis]